eukprot:SAG31_NODE_8963_length_1356_cov_1.139220_1_plen_96_part_10
MPHTRRSLLRFGRPAAVDLSLLPVILAQAVACEAAGRPNRAPLGSMIPRRYHHLLQRHHFAAPLGFRSLCLHFRLLRLLQLLDLSHPATVPAVPGA